ncbi:MAG: pantoate--beta-alanine ligase [Flavobacteriales bacterium]
MEVITSPFRMAEWSAERRRKGHRIGFVPTMGALHEGHLELVNQARRNADSVVASIFVNPLQFNDPNDFKAYPSRPEEDREALERTGCDALFLPLRDELFSGFTPKHYDLGSLDTHWEGPNRPGHFQGMVNVVERLFHFTRPDFACFGQKDWQQLAIIQWVTKHMRWPVEIMPCPTVRESDGLALSSRNLRLSPEERSKAPVLHRALTELAQTAFDLSLADSLEVGRRVIATEPSLELEYLGIADPETLEPLEHWPNGGTAIALVAARLGAIRLIDNLRLERH